MRIGFDGKRALRNNTGLGNYSRSTVRLLASRFIEDHFVLYGFAKKQHEQLKALLSLDNVELRGPSALLSRSFWRMKGILKDLKKDKIDLYHGLSHELPFGIQKAGIKSVVTIHDLIFLRFPEYYSLVDRMIYRSKFQYACREADTVIAISQQTKKDIIHFFGIPEEKIKVVYQSCHPLFGETASKERLEEVKLKYKLPGKFLLSVGTIEKRKNALLTLKAMAQLPQPIPLILIGKHTSYCDELYDFMYRNNLKDQVRFIHQLPFQDLPAFYQLATAMVYPSRFEGFGIPVIEALFSRIPVIAATGSCLEEAGGPNSLYVDPDDDYTLARHISQLWNNPVQRREMAQNGWDYTQQFSEVQVAENLMSVYQETLNR